MESNFTVHQVADHVVEALTAAIIDNYPHVNVKPKIITGKGERIHYFDISPGNGRVLAIVFDQAETSKSFRLLSIVATQWFVNTPDPQWSSNLIAHNIKAIHVNPIRLNRFLITGSTDQREHLEAHIEVGAETLIGHARQAFTQLEGGPSGSAKLPLGGA